jgi:hypothetical protein
LHVIAAIELSFQNTGPTAVLSDTRKKESVEGPLFHFFSRQRDFDEGRLAFAIALMKLTDMSVKVFCADAEFTFSAGVWLPCGL